MSKKHFVALAARITKIADAEGRRQAAEAVADVCQDLCPRFDRARFIAACGSNKAASKAA